MKARKVVLTNPKGEFRIATEELAPERISPKGMVLKTELAGICATDTHIYNGEIPGFKFPVVLGHEFVGTIYNKGKELVRDTAGQPIEKDDRIIPMPATPCCCCPQCVLRPGPVIDCENYDVTGFTLDEQNTFRGGLAEYIQLDNPNTRFFKTEMPAAIAVLAEPFCTPVHGVQRAGVRVGDTVLVQGSGAIGILAITAAISAGATKVAVIGGPKLRLELCKEFGADLTIDISDISQSEDRIACVRDFTKGRGVDVAIEAAGVATAIPEGIQCLKNGGRYLEIGCFADVGSVLMNPNKLFLGNNITLVGSSGYGADHFLQAISILEAGRFPFAKLVSHTVALDKTESAIKALLPENKWQLDGEEVVKITIDPSL